MTLQMQAELGSRHSVASFSPVTQHRPCVLRHRQATRCQAVATNLLSRTQQSIGKYRDEAAAEMQHMVALYLQDKVTQLLLTLAGAQVLSERRYLIMLKGPNF